MGQWHKYIFRDFIISTYQVCGAICKVNWGGGETIIANFINLNLHRKIIDPKNVWKILVMSFMKTD